MLKIKIFVLYLFISNFFSVYAQKDSNNFLAISDIHFNPYDICFNKNLNSQCKELMSELIANDSSSWKEIFEKYYKNVTISSYGSNTNYPLFQSFLMGVQQAYKNTNSNFVVILGDYLGHDYNVNYKLYSVDLSGSGYENFVKKTFEYLAAEIKNSLPSSVEVYSVIGNNDSYIEDYNVDNPKTSKFYNDLMKIWNNNTEQFKFSNSFLNGGYYIAKTPLKGLSVVALNTNPFSNYAMSKDKTDIHKMVKDELSWFNYHLTNAKSQKILVISHIPFGIDPYASIKSMQKKGLPIPFWQSNEKSLGKNYLKILSSNFSSIAGILNGHTHSDSFQIINNDLALYSVSIPSLSPAHSNNSGFKVFTLDESNSLKNAITYFLDRTDNTWRQEYNFNETYESQNLFLGMQSMVGKWFKNQNEVDEKYLKYFNLGANSSKVKSNWLYYICAANDNLNIEEYNDCITSIH